jgi:hypothetical protein
MSRMAWCRRSYGQVMSWRIRDGIIIHVIFLELPSNIERLCAVKMEEPLLLKNKKSRRKVMIRISTGQEKAGVMIWLPIFILYRRAPIKQVTKDYRFTYMYFLGEFHTIFEKIINIKQNLSNLHKLNQNVIIIISCNPIFHNVQHGMLMFSYRFWTVLSCAYAIICGHRFIVVGIVIIPLVSTTLRFKLSETTTVLVSRI